MKGRFLIALSLFLAPCVSCTKPESGEEDAPLSVTLDRNEASYKADGVFVTVGAPSDWTLDIEPESAKEWARLSKTSGSGSSTAVLSYDYNGSDATRSLQVVLSDLKGKSVTADFKQNGVSGEPVDSDARPQWLELPEKTDLRFVSHSFSWSGSRYRNYSIGWDASSRLSQWVAYPLCNFHLRKNVSRTDAWDFDPSVPRNEQANLTRSYSGSYDRGHQIPSADRYICYEANAQTFYFTNMTPQRSRFNSPLWGNIEGSVRSWASTSDTLYVVTGCVMDGKSGSTTDAAGQVCPLPYAYYKAVLRYNAASTQGWGGFTAIGIYLEHARNYGATESLTKDMVMSVSKLEEILGYRLFVNLDAKLGAEVAKKVKSQDPKDLKYWFY